jgi:hypothetical protein
MVAASGIVFMRHEGKIRSSVTDWLPTASISSVQHAALLKTMVVSAGQERVTIFVT